MFGNTIGLCQKVRSSMENIFKHTSEIRVGAKVKLLKFAIWPNLEAFQKALFLVFSVKLQLIQCINNCDRYIAITMIKKKIWLLEKIFDNSLTDSRKKSNFSTKFHPISQQFIWLSYLSSCGDPNYKKALRKKIHQRHDNLHWSVVTLLTRSGFEWFAIKEAEKNDLKIHDQ